MKREDVDRLSKKYPDGNEEHRFEIALGSHLKETSLLFEEIYSSLDETEFGIGWWKTYEKLSLGQRILVSDQLCQPGFSVQSNMTEAKLHLMELLGEWEKENRSYDDGVIFEKGQFKLNHPLKLSPCDDLTIHLADMHLKGFLGSLTAAIDCMAAIIVGVVGLKLEIYRVGFSDIESYPGTKLFGQNETQIKFFERLDNIVSSAGPSGWKKWLFDYRNMVLHRGRRIQYRQFGRRETGLLSSKGEKIIRSNLLRSLVRDPRLSNVESMKNGLTNILTEHAEVTLEELFKSTVFLIEELSKELLQIWNSRKIKPNLIEQPSEQWPKVREAAYNFEGYSPNSLNWNVALAYASEAVVRQMKAASLADKDIDNWKFPKSP